MPVYNENQYIRKILQKVQNVDIKKEIIIIDDGSTDGTRKFLKNLQQEKNQNNYLTLEKGELRIDNIRIYLQPKNMGKGAALKKGFNKVNGEIVIVQDADLEYDPEDYKKLIKPIIDGRADVVYGSRFLTGKEHRVLYFWHSIANKFLTLLSNMLTDLNLTDMETCYKMFRSEILEDIEIQEDAFGIEPEITAKISKKDCVIYEVGISYHGRTYEEGKKIGKKDAIRALYAILKYNIL